MFFKKNLTEEELKANSDFYWNKMREYNCYSEEMEKFLMPNLSDCPATNTTNMYGCWRGGLIQQSILICKYITQLNDILPTKLKCEKAELIKIALVSNIGKVFLFEIETIDWKKKNGAIYKYNDNMHVMGIRDRSVYYCLTKGISLDESDVSALLSENLSLSQVDNFSEVKSDLLRIATKLATIELKNL